MNRAILTVDGPRANRVYFFPESVDEIQVNAIVPHPDITHMAYYAGLIYKVVPAGFGVWHGVFQRRTDENYRSNFGAR